MYIMFAIEYCHYHSFFMMYNRAVCNCAIRVSNGPLFEDTHSP